MSYIVSYEDQHHHRRDDGEWVPDQTRKSITRYCVFWEQGKLWWEVFCYLAESRCKSETIRSRANDLNHYANWLEKTGLHWLHFPLKKSDRCLYRYRAHLIDNANGTSSVPSRRIRAVVNFYQYARTKGLIDRQLEMWEDRQLAVSFFDSSGFERTAGVWSTDLRITQRKANISTVEGGLLPLSAEDRDLLLKYLRDNTSELNTVLHAMLTLGFFTGARIGSIRTLRIENLRCATHDPHDPNVMLVAAGPGTGIETKFGVAGYLRFLKPVHKFILDYSETNITRLDRQLKATKESQSLVFLTKGGRPYSPGAINVAMKMLRDALVRDGLTQFHEFKFHQSRATCGTELARIYMALSDDANAIVHVRDWLMHKDEKTTWTYINFLKNTKAAASANEAFTEQFLGPNL